MIEGQRRFPIAVRLPEHYRNDSQAIGDLILQAPGGERVRLNQVIARSRGSAAQNRFPRERAAAHRGAGECARARSRQFRRRSAAEDRSPRPAAAARLFDRLGRPVRESGARHEAAHDCVTGLALLIIFGLLFATFQSTSQALLILLNVPFALVGGIAALWLRGLNLNLSASIGFIALFGVAVLNGIVMVSYINRLRRRRQDLAYAVRGGRIDASAARADDSAGGQPGLCSDGDIAQHRSGSSAAPGDCRYRRPHHFHAAYAVSSAVVLIPPSLSAQLGSRSWSRRYGPFHMSG